MIALCPTVHKGGESEEKGKEKYERKEQKELRSISTYGTLLLLPNSLNSKKYDSKQQPSPYNM